MGTPFESLQNLIFLTLKSLFHKKYNSANKHCEIHGIYVDPYTPSEKSAYPPYLLWGTESKNPLLQHISVHPFWTYVTNFKFLISKLCMDNYTLSLPNY